VSIRRKIIRTKGLLERTVDRAFYSFSGDHYEVTVDGLTATFTVRTFADYRRARHLSNERKQVSFLLSEVRDDDVFWDIGSCVGSYSCLVGQVASETVAFEPHPGNAQILEENIQRNGLGDRVTVHEGALGAREETTELFVSPTESGGGHHSLVERGLDQTIDVRVCTADSLSESPSPDVVKIDVEGSEEDVIAGGKERFTSDCRLVLIEVHAEADDVTLEQQLSDLGFEVERKWGGEEHVFLVGRSSTS
jgi:FkbM family methyltransferase